MNWNIGKTGYLAIKNVCVVMNDLPETPYFLPELAVFKLIYKTIRCLLLGLKRPSIYHQANITFLITMTTRNQ